MTEPAPDQAAANPPGPTPVASAPAVAEAATRRQRRRRRILLVLQLLNLLVLGCLLTIYVAYATVRQQEPVYSWVRGTRVEGLCRRLAPLLSRQQRELAQHTESLPLTAEETTRWEPVRRKMADILPRHVVVLKSGESLFGWLVEAPAAAGQFTLRRFDGQRFQLRELKAEQIAFRSVLVFPTGELTPEDIRFLIRSENANHYFLAPYVFTTYSSFARVQQLYFTFSLLEQEFRQAFGPLVAQQETLPHIHVRLFADEREYLTEVTAAGAAGPVNAAGVYREEAHCLLLCDGVGAPPGGRFPHRGRLPGTADPNAIARHEAAHHFAAVFQVLPAGDEVPFWLVEGLAQYCERSLHGEQDAERLAFLARAQQEQRLLPWDRVLGLTLAEVAEVNDDTEKLAYAQSWFCFNHLMDGKHRPLFLRHLLALSERPPRSSEDDLLTELMNALDTTPARLVAELGAALPPAPAP